MKNKYFSKSGLEKAILEIKLRHKKGYKGLINEITKQVKEFYKTLPKESKLVFGLSGGIDSTTVTHLLVKAVGKQNVIVINLPVRKDDEGIKYFKETVRTLGIGSYFYNISRVTKSTKWIYKNKYYFYSI